jgi:hypothetical protein
MTRTEARQARILAGLSLLVSVLALAVAAMGRW